MSGHVPTEYEEQCILVEWLELKRLKFTHIPNSTYTKSWGQKMRNKKSGVRAGLCDMVIVLPKKLLFLELKRAKKSLSRVSEEQKEWIEALNAIGDQIEAIVCYGAESAIVEIEKRLKS